MKFTQFVKEYLVKNKDSGLTYREAMKDDGVRCAYKQFEADLCKAGIVRETEERPVAKRKYVKKPKVIEENITINENAPVAAPAQPQRQPSAPAKIGYTPPPRTAPPRQVQPQQARVPSEDPFYQANPLLAQRAEEAIRQYNEMVGKKTSDAPAPVEPTQLSQKRTVTINPETDFYAPPAETMETPAPAGAQKPERRPATPTAVDAGYLSQNVDKVVPLSKEEDFVDARDQPEQPVYSWKPRPKRAQPPPSQQGSMSIPRRYGEESRGRQQNVSFSTALENEPTTFDPVPPVVLQREPQPYRNVDENAPVMPGPDPWTGASLDRRLIEYRPDEPTEDPVERVDAGVEAGVQTSIPPAPRPATADAGNQTDYLFSAGQTPVRRSQFPTRRSARRTTPSATADLNRVRNDIVELGRSGEITTADVNELSGELEKVEKELDSDEVSAITASLAEGLQADNTGIPVDNYVNPSDVPLPPEGEGEKDEEYRNKLGYEYFFPNAEGQSDEVKEEVNPIIPGTVKMRAEEIEKKLKDEDLSRKQLQDRLSLYVVDPKTGKKKKGYKSVKLNATKDQLRKYLANEEAVKKAERAQQGERQRQREDFYQQLEEEDPDYQTDTDRRVVSEAGESGPIIPPKRNPKRKSDDVDARGNKRLNVIEEEEGEEEGEEEEDEGERKRREYEEHLRSLPVGTQLAARYVDLPVELQRQVKLFMDRDEFAPATEEEVREARKAISEGRDSMIHYDLNNPKRRRLYRIISDVRRAVRQYTPEEIGAMSPMQRENLIKKQAEGRGLSKTDKLKKIMHALIDVSL